MKLEKIDKKEEGKFITRYDITYKTVDDTTKIYEMISRNRNVQTREELRGNKPDAVVLMVTDESGEKIVLNKEFRMAAGTWVYNFPAGLELYEINDELGLSYSAVGFSNEMNVCVIGKARGEFRQSTSNVEEIEAGWYTKEEVRNLLKTERFAARTQAYCYLWANK